MPEPAPQVMHTVRYTVFNAQVADGSTQAQAREAIQRRSGQVVPGDCVAYIGNVPLDPDALITGDVNFIKRQGEKG